MLTGGLHRAHENVKRVGLHCRANSGLKQGDVMIIFQFEDTGLAALWRMDYGEETEHGEES